MRVIDHEAAGWEDWRPGVRTRMRVAAAWGAQALCVFEQHCNPGAGAPVHTHTVEEVLTVLAGAAAVSVGAEQAVLKAGQSVVVPAGVPHGFSNIGETVLHVQAILAAPVFEATFQGQTEITRRWVAG